MPTEGAVLFAALLTAHLVGDFVVQTTRQVERKRRPRALLGHAIVVAALSYLLAGLWTNWAIPAVILVTHTAIDAAKATLRRDGIVPFLVDQIAHLAVIAALARRFGPGSDPALGSDAWFAILVLASGAIAATQVAAVIVGLQVRPLQERLTNDDDVVGIPGAGATIGKLERALIFVFVLAGETAGVGFLIAAKSILRFGQDRRVAEYIIIGTLLSFLLAIVAANATRAALVHAG